MAILFGRGHSPCPPAQPQAPGRPLPPPIPLCPVTYTRSKPTHPGSFQRPTQYLAALGPEWFGRNPRPLPCHPTTLVRLLLPPVATDPPSDPPSHQRPSRHCRWSANPLRRFFLAPTPLLAALRTTTSPRDTKRQSPVTPAPSPMAIPSDPLFHQSGPAASRAGSRSQPSWLPPVAPLHVPHCY